MKTKVTICPHCGTDWDAGDIYEVLQKNPYYQDKTDEEVKIIAGYYGWSEENKIRFSNIIGIEDPRIYDGVSWWACPQCNTRWDRNDPVIYTNSINELGKNKL